MSKFHSPAESIGRLSTGCFLVARPPLRDPNFEKAIILLCAHEEDGDYGLILNRAAIMPLDEIFESLPPPLRSPRSIGIGGPVEQDKVQILDWSGDPAPESQAVAQGLTMGGQWDFTWRDGDYLETPGENGKLFHLSDPTTYRIFLGYAGWAPNQLRDEIELGAWEVFQADIQAFLSLPAEVVPPDCNAFREWAFRHPVPG